MPVPILMTVRDLNLGGIERDVAKIAIGMDRGRFIPHVASYNAAGMRFEEIRNAGVPFLHLPVRSLKSKAAVASAFRLWRYIRQNGIRLVHAWDATAPLVLPAAWLAGVPALLSSVLGYRTLLDARTVKQLRASDRLVRRMVVNCEAMRDHVVEDEGFQRERVDLCYNGVDTTEFYPAPPERLPDLEGATLVVGAICALRSEKNLTLLQEAFARVCAGTGAKLLIVGSGSELPSLQANAKRLRIEAQSVFHPATAEVARHLRSIDIFVLCSRSEAFSNALLEAMACGCACVGSRVGGTPEMLGVDGERGLLFENGDAPGLASRLEHLLASEPARREMGRKAAEFARTSLSIERAVDRISEIYEHALKFPQK